MVITWEKHGGPNQLFHIDFGDEKFFMIFPSYTPFNFQVEKAQIKDGAKLFT